MASERAAQRYTAIFGGSFNPPHVGHVLAVAYVRAVYPVDEVLVIPVYQHPFDKALASFEQRMEMARLAMGWIDGVRISDIERRLGSESSRTLYTIEALLTEQPERKLRLVVGADVLFDRHKWHRFDRIEELAPPIVLGRAGVEHPEAPEAVLPEISSTRIRALLASGDVAACQPHVPRSVLAYVQQQGLYRTPASAS